MQFCHKANVYSGHVDFRLPKQIVKRLFAFGWTASRAKEKIRMATRVTSPANATRSLSSVWTNVQGKWYHAQIMTNMYAMLRSWRIRTSVGIWLWVFFLQRQQRRRMRVFSIQDRTNQQRKQHQLWQRRERDGKSDRSGDWRLRGEIWSLDAVILACEVKLRDMQ